MAFIYCSAETNLLQAPEKKTLIQEVDNTKEKSASRQK